MKQASLADPASPAVEPESKRQAWKGRRLTEVGSWIVIVLAIGLLTLAAGRRLRRAQNAELSWVTVRSTSADVDQSPDFVAGPASTGATDAGPSGFTADLSALGQGLDDPSLGQRETDTGTTDAEAAQIPRSRRWRLHFPSGLTEGQYARQLDSLGIELGIFADGETIQYVAELGGARYKTRTAPRSDEERLYLTWNRGDLEQADRAILANAGVAGSDRIVLHFCPAETVEQLTNLEQEHQGRKAATIQLTVFSFERTFRGYEIYVMEQVPR